MTRRRLIILAIVAISAMQGPTPPEREHPPAAPPGADCEVTYEPDPYPDSWHVVEVCGE